MRNTIAIALIVVASNAFADPQVPWIVPEIREPIHQINRRLAFLGFGENQTNEQTRQLSAPEFPVSSWPIDSKQQRWSLLSEIWSRIDEHRRPPSGC